MRFGATARIAAQNQTNVDTGSSARPILAPPHSEDHTDVPAWQATIDARPKAGCIGRN
jgi:hypothetical protein